MDFKDFPYLTVTICERDIEDIHFHKSQADARAYANAMLEKHMTNIGYLDELKSREDYGSEWEDLQDEDATNAWCNYSCNWDCYVMESASVGL